MRKKSHVSLSLYLIKNIDNPLLSDHKKAFVMGSILPDCKPSFVTTKHNIEETFEMVTAFISKLTVDSDDFKKISTSYCRKLGEVTHYLADYFTFPHNGEFDGNMKDHCMHEKYLKYALKDYIHSEEVYINSQIASTFNTPEQLCQFVMWLHDSYINSHESIDSNKDMGSSESIRRDCKYIVTMTHIVTAGILHLMEINRNLEEGYIEREKSSNWRILQTFQGKFVSDKMYSIPFRKQRKNGRISSTLW